MLRRAFVALVSLATFGCAHHHGHGGSDDRGIRVSAQGRASAAPDEASIVLGVRTDAPTAAAAAADNARKQQAILAAVKSVLPAGSMVQTQGYNISPVFAHDQHGGAPRITGYQVSNTVHIRLHEMSLVGKVIDLAIGAGANEVQGLSFGVKDPGPLRARAVEDAARRARAEAELLARSLGLVITGIKLVEIGGPPAVMPFEKSMALARVGGDAATPIESGEVESSVQVTVTFDTSR